jgi:predicted amino acid-binding ACT domain protein
MSIVVSLIFAETAIAIVDTEQQIIDEKLTLIQEKIDTEWEAYREFYIYTLQEELANTASEREKKILEVVLSSITKQPNEYIETQDTLSDYHIDSQQVLQTWMDWQNTVRTDLGLDIYENNSLLNNSALKWSQISKERGYIDHKRHTWDGYYNYKKIESWMKWELVICKNIARKTFSESIWYGSFRCDDGECTDELINGMKSTFTFFMSEKRKKYDPHYRAIISPYFGTIGTGIELTKTGKNTYKYYLTTHYCTELITN